MNSNSIVKNIWKPIKAVFLAYAVVFTVVMTIVLLPAVLFVSKPYFAVKKLKTENPKQTLYMNACQKMLNDSGEVDTLMHIFVPLDSISPILIKSVIAAEDDGFYIHPGFDLAAIIQAYESNRAKNRITHGASTLTQQMAKNLFVGGERRFSRKYLELAYTVLLEALLGKERILELYLNYAQWGKNIFGCEAASLFYYKKSCKEINLDEAARLAAVLAKPHALNPHYSKSILLQKRLRVIGDNLYMRNVIDEIAYITIAGSDSLIHVYNSQSKADSLLLDFLQTNSGLEHHEQHGSFSSFTKPEERQFRFRSRKERKKATYN